MAVITVNTTNYRGKGSLRGAIWSAQSGDVIKFDPILSDQTIILEQSYSIDKNLTIDASDAPGLTLDGNRQNVIFNVNGKGRVFSVKDLTLANASHGYNGAAIRATNSDTKITVEGSEFRNNTGGLGAAIYAKTNAEVTVINSQFYGNRSTIANDQSAGAIGVFDRSKLTVVDSEFIGNHGISGGAIGTIFTELTIEDSVFKNNDSVRWSGAVHADGASIPLQDRYYSGDRPRDSVGKSIIIRNNHFENNRSNGHGGAVGVWGYDQDFVTIDRNDFIGNQVTQNKSGIAKGGALRVSGKQVTIADSRFINNTSANEGGALWHQGESSVTIKNTLFQGNQADRKGGAIFNHQWNGPGTEIINSTFRENQALSGSVIYKNKPRPISIVGSEFERNGSGVIGGDLRNLSRHADGEGANFESYEPVTQLNFNEAQGNTAANLAPGQDSPAKLIRATWTDGIEGGALSLNGNNQYATLDNSEDINLGIHDQRTISFWFKVDDASIDSRKQVLYEEGAGWRGLNAYVHDDSLYVGGWNEPTGESGWNGTWLSTNEISSDEWHHVAFVLDGSNSIQSNALTAFLDGQEFGTGEGSQLWDHSGGIGIGALNRGTKFHDGSKAWQGHGLSGSVDEVQIFNNALDPFEVQSLSQA